MAPTLVTRAELPRRHESLEVRPPRVTRAELPRANVGRRPLLVVCHQECGGVGGGVAPEAHVLPRALVNEEQSIESWCSCAQEED